MNDTIVTLHGWVGSEVRFRVVNGVMVANIRVGSTPRIKKGEEWVDGETTWYSVTAWRTLADHLRQCVRKGDPVIVHGRLRTETWTPEGDRPASTSLLVEASLVGHDLTRGLSNFYRPVRPEAVVGTQPEPEQSDQAEQTEGTDDAERTVDSVGADGDREVAHDAA